MLPTSFYLSKHQICEESSTDGTPPSEELVKCLMLDLLGYLWHAEDHMNSAHEMADFSPSFSLRWLVLRIFTHRDCGVDHYTGVVYEAARHIVRTG
jgi:hypothetical protein